MPLTISAGPPADSFTLRATLPADLRAGLVTFLVALPLCLGIALASGAPPLAGIVAGVVGGLVVGSLSGSSTSVSGPAAGLTTIVAAGIARCGSLEAFGVAVLLAGLLQIGLGAARAGGIASFFPSSVIRGMLAAIGLTLMLKQIPHAVGWDPDPEGDFEFFQTDDANTFTELARALRYFTPAAVLISALSLGVQLLWARPVVQRLAALRVVPGALVTVLLGVLVNEWLRAAAPAMALGPSHLVALPTAFDTGQLVRLPAFHLLGTKAIWLTAATLVVVASLETMLSIEAADKLDPLHRRTPVNRELLAQGVGNTVSGLLGGLPLTSVIVRSSVNIQTGARTKRAAITHGALLLVCVLLIPGLLNRIPLAALAGVLLFVGYKLTNPALYRQQWALGLNQFLPFIVTIGAVLLTDLLIGIGIGVAAGIFFILRANYHRAYTLQQEAGSRIRIDLAEHVSFINKASILGVLDGLPDDAVVEIDARRSRYVDHDVVEAIESFAPTARRRNIELTFHRPA